MGTIAVRQPFEPELVIPSDELFWMGSDPKKDRETQEWEQPPHGMYLRAYYLAKTPVTNAQYAAFTQTTGHKPPGYWQGGKLPKDKDDHPVVYVSWRDAMAYCRWLSAVTGKAYSLPSEAEWEKGARGGDGRIYPWGDKWDARRCNTEGSKGDTTPVGAYPQGASPYGLLDMAGNVWEWTRSIFRPYPYTPHDGRDDIEAEGDRVVRGGSFLSFVKYVRCACRLWCEPDSQVWDYGFRVCVVVR